MSWGLAPLKKPSDKSAIFGVCDIETANWTEFLVIGYLDVTGFTYFTKLEAFFDHVFQHSPVPDVFAHFGGKFDMLFLLEYLYTQKKYHIDSLIPRGSMLLCFDLIDTKTKRKICFRDSSAILPFGLRALCDNFKVDHPKLDIDYTKIKKVTPKLLRYLEFDCRGLYECLEKFFNWPLIREAGPVYTIAGQAMRVLRLFLDKPVSSLGQGVDAWVRQSYFGGRTEVFKPYFDGSPKKLIHCFDVNSLYPTMMLNEFPNTFKCMTTKYTDKGFGFWDVEVEVPEMWIPPLGAVLDLGTSKKFVFPVGTFRGFWTTHEIEYAKTLGVKVRKVYKGALFNSGGFIFKDYVEELYDIRMKAAKDSVDNVMAKLLMNSCYGRFGIRRDREGIAFDEGQVGVIPFSEMRGGKYPIRLVKEAKHIDTFSNVAVPSYVTSYARVHMHKLLLQTRENVFYMDTDSLLTPEHFKSSGGLGALKHEYSAESACFLLPKTYCIDGLHGMKGVFRLPKTMTLSEASNHLKVEMADLKEMNRFKNVHRKLPIGTELAFPMRKKVVMKGFDRKKSQNFTLDDFATALDGDMRRLSCVQASKIATFKTALRKNKFVTMMDESSRGIRSIYDKRVIEKDRKGDFTTRPLTVRNGVVEGSAEKRGKLIKALMDERDTDSI